ncbi:MAG TPA: hypothetical protein VFI11_13455 [Anaerolineales bacterium]|nr:hypothetical protein [Anaerolineales bacterium]
MRRGLPAHALLLALAAACGSLPPLPSLPTLPANEIFPVTTLDVSFDPGQTFVMPPSWQVPDVPEDVLAPIPGAAPQWWEWVPIHPAIRAGGEYDGGFHYRVDLAATDMLNYYQEALRQAGWQASMAPFVSGDYSYLSYARYEASATIYISPGDSGSLISIVVE